jgi:two-component system sensor histidine kinase HydH
LLSHGIDDIRERIHKRLKPSPVYLRWGLLVSSVAMAAVLVATGLWVRSGIRQAASTVTQGQTIAIAFTARRALRPAAEINARALQEVLEELAAQGLRYLEVRDADRTLVAAAGKQANVRWSGGGNLGPAATIGFGPGGSIARLLIRPSDTPGTAPGRPSGQVPSPAPPDHPLHGKHVLFEVDSAAAHALAWRAQVTLAVSVLAALVLMGLCAVFWRISRNAEKASAQLERDRQLKVLGQMSAVLGHEIKNPLASLKGHVQLLLEKLPPDHAGRKGAEIVLRETVRLEELSRQVLEFARTGAVACESADPAAVVRAAIDDAGSNDIHLHAEAAPAAWPLDSARMEEVLVNLLRNARDASPVGQPIDVALDVQADRHLVIEVRDRGEGIPAGEEERVFEPFYTRRAKGTGLGLALARRIVEGHGGAITARNHAGGGAVFSVRLPPPARGV